MGWEWVLLLLRLEPWPIAFGDGVGIRWRLAARHFETDRPYFATYSSRWNERLKLEAKKELWTGGARRLFSIHP